MRMLLQVLRSLGMGSTGAGQAVDSAAQQQQEASDEEQWTDEEEEASAAGVSDDEVCGVAWATACWHGAGARCL
jgi:hypothetical protein